MQKNERNSIYVNNTYSIITPEQLKTQFPVTHLEQKTILDSQNIIMNIIHRRDPRLLVICGPCSIHDVNAAFDYAGKLKTLSTELQDQLYIVMRVYLEKPRTSIGWKGLINDPHMNDSNDIELGLKIARHMLVKLIKIGLPLATEVLNPYIPQYIGELFSWSSIGARTTESQIHREIASGLYTPVGFKNSTSGNFSNAVNAIHAAMMPHRYISINQSGQVCLLHTKGNLNAHIILRGGENPNYYPEDIIGCEKKITEAGLPLALMVDCSHGNSNKDYRRQIDVARSVSHQIKYGNRSIIGLMIESYIYSGNQSINLSSSTTQYGVSVTDACIDWKTTKHLLYDLHKELKPFLINRISGAGMV
ncbi:Phospho-2-dehydro-3-deoxyheptonate aldolase, Tyr-sensitive [Candidatus Blochmanniella chromaiodes str. 640]|uniref:Phospho-2-dehydro-3-deoxyheptonate aldolase n=1 Tax=Candidatus Blochmanniella chromaiodes str. 640 TaxID=1240471 RepID=A0ABM5ND07_9ENTR|nr:3-deoxy-7-phosphoheptulonate synthase [Candidatus Blochmannia chromaiodes]AGC03463.1 Phospho-2-dehydro-3-deoxyheptonate aldolase, Tyr-sensitive [Candidatus Blochmannia chromaiodes str. 640]